MTRAWLTVLLAGTITMMIKGTGPLLLGGRLLPSRALPVLRLLAPSLFAALIVSQVFTHGERLVLDARTAGLIAAVAGAAYGARPVLILLGACAATAAFRFVMS